MDYHKSIGVLNNFIQINNDRIKHHQTASNTTQDDALKAIFNQCVTTSQQCNEELSKEVTLLGGIPVIEDSITSSNFIRAWMEVEHVLQSKDMQPLVSCSENKENIGMCEYKKVLQEGFLHLSHSQQKMIETHIQYLKTEHEIVKQLNVKD